MALMNKTFYGLLNACLMGVACNVADMTQKEALPFVILAIFCGHSEGKKS